MLLFPIQLYSVKSQYPRLLDHVADNEFQLEKDLFSDKSFFYGKKLQALNISSTTDIKFLSDMQLFKEVTDSVSTI